MYKSTAACLVIASFAFGVLVGMPRDPALITNTTGDTQLEIPTCATEDDTNCFWDATVRGNKTGQSFIDFDGSVYYKASN